MMKLGSATARSASKIWVMPEDINTPTEFGGDPGLVQPREKVVDYEPVTYLQAIHTTDPADPESVEDTAKIGKPIVYRKWNA